MKLTPEEKDRLYFELTKPYPNTLRFGQRAMNLLYEINPAVYRYITDTELDPFFDDSRLAKFFHEI